MQLKGKACETYYPQIFINNINVDAYFGKRKATYFFIFIFSRFGGRGLTGFVIKCRVFELLSCTKALEILMCNLLNKKRHVLLKAYLDIKQCVKWQRHLEYSILNG